MMKRKTAGSGRTYTYNVQATNGSSRSFYDTVGKTVTIR